MLFSITFACLVSIILGLTTSTTAHPRPRFAHRLQSLQYRDNHRTPYKESRTSRLLHYLKPRPRLHRRGLPGAVYICTDQNFRGDCSWIMPNDECHIPGTGEFAPESIGPDPGGSCVLFETATCTGDRIETLRFPGRATGMPAFMGLKCYADVQVIATNASSPVQNGVAVGSGILPAGKDGSDPRLAGGFGSAEAKRLQNVLQKMEKEGFKDGMIGLKKDHYY